jgi:hypothetical protein
MTRPVVWEVVMRPSEGAEHVVAYDVQLSSAREVAQLFFQLAAEIAAEVPVHEQGGESNAD